MTAVQKVLLMMGKMLPETCWAAFTRLNNKRFYSWVCIWLIVLFEYMKKNGTTNHKHSTPKMIRQKKKKKKKKRKYHKMQALRISLRVRCKEFQKTHRILRERCKASICVWWKYWMHTFKFSFTVHPNRHKLWAVYPIPLHQTIPPTVPTIACSLPLICESPADLWRTKLLGFSWNVMAHGDAREGKWKENWQMEWVASTFHTTSERGVSSITTADVHNSAASSRLNWRSRRFK
jgi:hypothetical protein